MLLPADAVEEIVGLRAAHARDEDEALDARRLGRIDLRLGAQPVDLLGRACSGFGLGLGFGLWLGFGLALHLHRRPRREAATAAHVLGGQRGDRRVVAPPRAVTVGEHGRGRRERREGELGGVAQLAW